MGERPDHDPQPNRRTDPGAIVVLCIAYIHSHTPPHRLAHTAEIRTAVGGVLVRSCSGADLRLPGIPRRIKGGGDLSAIRERIATLHRPLRGVGALPLTEV